MSTENLIDDIHEFIEDVNTEHNISKNMDKRISEIEKDVNKLKRFYKNNKHKKIVRRYQIQQNILLTIVGVVIMATTIPSAYNLFTYYNKMDELNEAIKAQKYISMANDADSDEKRIENLTYAIENNKQDPELYYRRGEVYYWMGNYEMALEDCEQALKYDQNYIDAIFLTGQIYYDIDKYEQAIKSFENAYSIDKENQVNAYIACSYYYLNNYEKALEYIDKSNMRNIRNIVKDASNESIHTIRIRCYLGLNKFVNAYESLLYLANSCRSVDDVLLTANQLACAYEIINDTESQEIITNMIIDLNNERATIMPQLRMNPNLSEETLLTKDDILLNEIKSRIMRLMENNE